MNLDKKKLKLLSILLFLAIAILIVILIMFSMRGKVVTDNIIKNAIEGTNWPIEDVPLLVNENIDVKNVGSYTCQANVASGVTYPELRNYLIELYNAGFEPNEALGSKNPKTMVESLDEIELKQVIWIASKDNYETSVIWAEDGALNEFDEEYEYNFDMTLFINPGNNNIPEIDDNIELENTENENSDDKIIENTVDNVSGESVMSGDANISGESKLSN